jgi:membrane protein
MKAGGSSNRLVSASSQPRLHDGPRLTGAWRLASAALRAGRNRLELTVAGRVCKQLRELGFINSSLQFAAVFTIGFIPFLALLSAVLGPDLPRAIVNGSGFSAKAGQDVTMLFAHDRTASTSLSILTVALAVLGGDAISHMVQDWYAKIFRAQVHGWKAMVRRVQWLAGVFGFVGLQVVIVRRVQPQGGDIAAAGAQFLLALAFWWWSLHCLLSGLISWRRLFLAGLATGVCYTGLAVYIAYVMSSSIVSNQARYGPIGTVMTLITAEIGLAVALQLGAAIGASVGHRKR